MYCKQLSLLLVGQVTGSLIKDRLCDESPVLIGLLLLSAEGVFVRKSSDPIFVGLTRRRVMGFNLKRVV